MAGKALGKRHPLENFSARAGLHRGRAGAKHKCYLRYSRHLHRPGGTCWRHASVFPNASGLGRADDKDTLARQGKATLLPSWQVTQ